MIRAGRIQPVSSGALFETHSGLVSRYFTTLKDRNSSRGDVVDHVFQILPITYSLIRLKRAYRVSHDGLLLL